MQEEGTWLPRILETDGPAFGSPLIKYFLTTLANCWIKKAAWEGGGGVGRKTSAAYKGALTLFCLHGILLWSWLWHWDWPMWNSICRCCLDLNTKQSVCYQYAWRCSQHVVCDENRPPMCEKWRLHLSTIQLWPFNADLHWIFVHIMFSYRSRHVRNKWKQNAFEILWIHSTWVAMCVCVGGGGGGVHIILYLRKYLPETQTWCKKKKNELTHFQRYIDECILYPKLKWTRIGYKVPNLEKKERSANNILRERQQE